MKASVESNYDVDRTREEDRTDYDLPVRARLTWSPSASLAGVAELRYSEQYRRDEDNGVNDSETSHDGSLGETWLQWRDQRLGLVEVQRPGDTESIGRRHQAALRGEPCDLPWGDTLPRDHWDPVARAAALPAGCRTPPGFPAPDRPAG